MKKSDTELTVWGVRYTHGGIDWLNSEAEARQWADCGRYVGPELVSITGHVRIHPATEDQSNTNTTTQEGENA